MEGLLFLATLLRDKAEYEPDASVRETLVCLSALCCTNKFLDDSLSSEILGGDLLLTKIVQQRNRHGVTNLQKSASSYLMHLICLTYFV